MSKITPAVDTDKKAVKDNAPSDLATLTTLSTKPGDSDKQLLAAALARLIKWLTNK